MTPLPVQTFHQSIGKQLVAKDPGGCQVLLDDTSSDAPTLCNKLRLTMISLM
jgi:hypothetical protein